MQFRVSPEAAKAQYAVAMLVAGADGKVGEEELETIRERLDARLAHLSERERDAICAETIQRVAQHGLDAVLQELAAELGGSLARHQAFHLAVDVALADGRLEESEQRRVLRIGEALGLDRGEAKRALDEARKK